MYGRVEDLDILILQEIYDEFLFVICRLTVIYCFVAIWLDARKFAEQNGLDTSFDTRKVTFTVVNSDEANAFVLPGNHVFCKSILEKFIVFFVVGT